MDIPVKGGSGRDLYVSLSNTEIYVSDKEIPWFQMNAFVNNGVLSFDLHTRQSSTGNVHPDFYAARFIKFTMNYFGTSGVEIKQFETYWINDSNSYETNYHQFVDYLTAHGDTKQNEVEAAKQTWTAKVMAKYGFSEVEQIKREIIEEEEIVTVLFSRPEYTSDVSQIGHIGKIITPGQDV